MSTRSGPRKGRGAASNRTGRYESLEREVFDDGWGGDPPHETKLRTEVGVDRSRTVLSFNRSPDVPFDRSVNPYRGCEHGCVYCYARPTHARLGLSPGLDFESKLFHKPDAPEQLRDELARKSYRPAPVGLGANTDCYQPLERRLGLTRRIIEVLAEARHPLMIVTKSPLVERDIDLLTPLAEAQLAEVHVSVTTLDDGLGRVMEPRTASGRRRLQTIRTLSEAGIPTGVLAAPMIPMLNDAELERILERAREAGARAARYSVIRLPLELDELFEEWIGTHYPLKARRVLHAIEGLRGGRRNSARFGERMVGRGPVAELLRARFLAARRRLGYPGLPGLDPSRFRPPRAGAQLELGL